MIKDGVRVDVAFTEHIALFEANSDRQQSKRELVGDVFELVTDLRSPAMLPVQEVQVVDDQQSDLARQHEVQRSFGKLTSATFDCAGVGKKVAQRLVEILHACTAL